jgi:teichuronic acid exporter
MTLMRQTIIGGSWLSLFKLISQIISWTSTIIVTRLLTSEDYGLMEMATIFTGYISFFVEFGIGAGIINKDTISKEELSSTFWFLLLWGLVLALVCLGLAPVTVSFFSEPRLYSLTQAVGILFILSSITIVPRSILHRELRFKEVGVIEIISVTLASIIMIIAASQGAGPWTLLIGFISRVFCTMVLLFIRSKFIPVFAFSFSLITPLLRFGTPIMLSTSLYYIYTKADRFFGGRSFGAEELGYYAIGLQLAAIPVEKIVSILQSVLFPTLSKLKYQRDSFNEVYLSFVSFLALVTFPLFIGGIIISNELVIVVLGEKWRPAVLPFQFLLASQLIMAVSAPNSLIHAARGKPKWNLLFNALLAPALVAGFYFSAQQDQLYLLALPWITIYPVFQFSYITITNRELGIPVSRYIRHLTHPALACLSMSLALFILTHYWSSSHETIYFIISAIILGGFVYSMYYYLFAKGFIINLMALKNKEFEI